MDYFECILIITSVIYALCMAPLLSGFVRVLQFDGKVKHCLPQALLAATGSLVMFVPMKVGDMQWWRNLAGALFSI